MRNKSLQFTVVSLFMMISTICAQNVIVHDNAQFAASELYVHLKKICNQEYSIVTEKEFAGDKPAFYVGQTAFAKKQGIDFASFAPEEWLYCTKDGSIILTGHEHNGSEYAVWHFLENELGVRWFTFESTYIPKKDKLAFGELNKRGKPAFLERQIYSASWRHGLQQKLLAQNIEFERRNRFNERWSPVRLSRQVNHCHSFYDYVSPDKYFKEHPEYFSMNKEGKRHFGKGRAYSQLCLSNPEVAQVAIKHLREYIAKDRTTLPKEKWPIMYDISQLDCTDDICQCPECRKIIDAEGGDSALVVLFVNRVAEAIADDYPEILLRTFAYVSTEKAPKTYRPAKNVVIRWCDVYTRSDCYRPLTSKFNDRQRELVDGWRKLDAHLALWDYWNMDIDGPYFTPPRVETMVDAIAPDMKYFRSSGFDMIFIEGETFQFRNPQNFYDLQYWMGTHLMEDPDLDPEALIADFVEKHYGPAAPKMREALEMLRKAVREDTEPMYYIIRSLRQYQTASFVNKFYGILKEARALTPEGSDYRFRVEKELLTPMAVMMATQGFVSSERRKELLDEYKAYKTARLDKYAAPDKRSELDKALQDDLDKFGFEVELPEQFKKYSSDQIRLLAYPQFATTEPDADSVTGRALASPPESPNYMHIMKQQAGHLKPSWFGAYDYPSKRSIQLNLNDIPQDEKYHWYRIGKFEIGKRSIVWGFFWRMEVKLDQFWTPADGAPEYNTWTVWISAKLTGPAYVKDSKKENRIFLDQVILVKE